MIKLHNAVVKRDGFNLFITFLVPIINPQDACERIFSYLKTEGFVEENSNGYKVFAACPKL